MTGFVGVMRLIPVTHTVDQISRTRTEEVPMSTMDTGSNGKGVKTLAIRLEPDLHAQLSLVAQLRRSTITDEIRAAIEDHIETVKKAPELAGKADSALAEIEREAAARRDAIATLFGTASSVAAPEAQPAGNRSRGRRGGGASADS